MYTLITLIVCTFLVCLTILMCAVMIIRTYKEKSSSLHKEEKGETVIEEERKNPSDNAVYSGIIHKFTRNGIKHERPVMKYVYNGKDVLMEYDEKGNKVFLSKKQKGDIELVLAGWMKSKVFKKYELKGV